MNDLIERYLYAVVKNLPYRLREDVGAELRSLIDDMLFARCGENPPGEHDVKAVLTELGSPSELADRYAPQKVQALIGPPYYRKYKTVLKIVLWAAGGGTLFAGILSSLLNPSPEVWYVSILHWLGTILFGLLFAFAFVTILFAVFQRRGIPLEAESIDNLPPVPQKHETIGRADPIIGIIISVLFAVVFLAAPQILCGIFDGEVIPVFNPQVVRSQWYLVILLAVAGITVESVSLYEGRYTRRLAAVTVIGNIFSGILTVFFLGNPAIINPDFIEKTSSLFSSAFLGDLFRNLNLLLLAVVSFALVLDMVTVLVKALKYSEY